MPVLDGTKHTIECANCKAPLNLACRCEDCVNKYNSSAYCHVCGIMHRAVASRTFFTDAHNQWAREQVDRKKRMGLEGN